MEHENIHSCIGSSQSFARSTPVILRSRCGAAKGSSNLATILNGSCGIRSLRVLLHLGKQCCFFHVRSDETEKTVESDGSRSRRLGQKIGSMRAASGDAATVLASSGAEIEIRREQYVGQPVESRGDCEAVFNAVRTSGGTGRRQLIEEAMKTGRRYSCTLVCHEAASGTRRRQASEAPIIPSSLEVM